MEASAENEYASENGCVNVTWLTAEAWRLMRGRQVTDPGVGLPSVIDRLDEPQGALFFPFFFCAILSRMADSRPLSRGV